jgi:hypothetical protein
LRGLEVAAKYSIPTNQKPMPWLPRDGQCCVTAVPARMRIVTDKIFVEPVDAVIVIEPLRVRSEIG